MFLFKPDFRCCDNHIIIHCMYLSMFFLCKCSIAAFVSYNAIALWWKYIHTVYTSIKATHNITLFMSKTPEVSNFLCNFHLYSGPIHLHSI